MTVERQALGAFAPEEHRRRAATLQAGMAAAELDALLLTGPADIFYVTGFLTRFWESPTRPWFVVLPVSGDPIAVIPSIGGAPFARTWIQDVRCWDSPNPADEGVSLLAETLASLVPPLGRIGTPMGPETRLGAPLADFNRLISQIASRDFIDATETLRAVRAVKSEPEIARLRAAAEAAGAALARLPEIAAPGRPPAEVFRRIQIACLEAGADWVAYLAGAAGAGGYADVISSASAETLSTGDLLMLDLGVVVGGYYCDFGRNLSIGPAASETRRAYAALQTATEAGIAAAKPGALAWEVHRAMAQRLEAEGFAPLGGRLGHGIGLALTEPPSLTPTDETRLVEGMTLAIEPGLEIGPSRIMVHEENIVLRADGADLLSPRAPARLPETALP